MKVLKVGSKFVVVDDVEMYSFRTDTPFGIWVIPEVEMEKKDGWLYPKEITSPFCFRRDGEVYVVDWPNLFRIKSGETEHVERGKNSAGIPTLTVFPKSKVSMIGIWVWNDELIVANPRGLLEVYVTSDLCHLLIDYLKTHQVRGVEWRYVAYIASKQENLSSEEVKFLEDVANQITIDEIYEAETSVIERTGKVLYPIVDTNTLEGKKAMAYLSSEGKIDKSESDLLLAIGMILEGTLDYEPFEVLLKNVEKLAQVKLHIPRWAGLQAVVNALRKNASDEELARALVLYGLSRGYCKVPAYIKKLKNIPEFYKELERDYDSIGREWYEDFGKTSKLLTSRFVWSGDIKDLHGGRDGKKHSI